jgi:predicted DNA-binding antitoxin AbrB/MazE fold protein
MKTIEAIYENGKIILKEKLDIKKARVLITFIESLDEEKNRVKFPTTDLGELKDIERSGLYDDYLSD